MVLRQYTGKVYFYHDNIEEEVGEFTLYYVDMFSNCTGSGRSTRGKRIPVYIDNGEQVKQVGEAYFDIEDIECSGSGGTSIIPITGKVYLRG